MKGQVRGALVMGQTGGGARLRTSILKANAQCWLKQMYLCLQGPLTIPYAPGPNKLLFKQNQQQVHTKQLDQWLLNCQSRSTTSLKLSLSIPTIIEKQIHKYIISA